MLERVYIENYKCLADFELTFEDSATLLLGPDGAGKTAVLDAVYGLCKLLAAEVKISDPIAFPASTLTRWQTCRHQEFGLQVRVGVDRFVYVLRIEHDAGTATSYVAREELVGGDTVLFRCAKGQVQLFGDDGSEGPTYRTDGSDSALARVVPHPSNTRITSFLDVVRNTVVCTINPYGLRSESSREDRLLDRYASNFVDWYRNAVQETPALARDHLEALRSAIEGFDDLHLMQSGLVTRTMVLRFTGGQDVESYRLSFGELSEGQRTLIVLYGLLQLGIARGMSV